MAPYSNLTTSFEGPVPHTYPHIAKKLSNSNGTDATMFTTSPSNIISTSTSTVFVVVTTVTSSPRSTVIVFTTLTPTPTTGLPSSALSKTNTRVLDNGAIIGIAVGGFSFIVLVLALATLLWRYKRRREIQKVKYTPWSIINSGSSNGRTGTIATSRPSNAISEASMLEVPIPTPYLFDSPSLPPRIDPFRGSPVDGRAILKSLVPHDYPVPQLLTQRIPSIYLDNTPMKMDGSTDASSPSVYEFDPDLDDLSHKAVDPHNSFITTKSRPLPIPLVLQPGISNRQLLYLRNPKSLRIETGNEHSKYSEPHQMLKPPPTALTRSRSREARAMAELIKAIDASSPSSQRRNSVSEIDESVGIAVTTPFKSRSPYGYSNASSQSSMTNTILHRLTADFPLPPTSSTLMDSNP
ncbi:hypothetical protein Clacol_002226 [Clathrus columnatus]|uniref:Uncharacterized protein n=1 Tax=Clathrus columnatus TaxID=1419009 RepID=A0AAV5A5J6_9AGAM|nr:hypothetical protein Clacol_002226 [Clathrus columnatus]